MRSRLLRNKIIVNVARMLWGDVVFILFFPQAVVNVACARRRLLEKLQEKNPYSKGITPR